MNRIGEFVLEQACIQLKSWHAKGSSVAAHVC